VDGTDLGSCSMAAFGISGVVLWVVVLEILVSQLLSYLVS
jgi:hypothetical protein